MKRKIDIFDYCSHICKAMSKGILITTKSGDFVNAMTIGWGTLGIEWGRILFVAYVRESRYTREILDKSGEFTVNIPVDDVNRNILRYCGTKSGRDTDKIQDLGLSLEEPSIVSIPGIKELPLTLECRVLYQQKQNARLLPEDRRELYYPEDNRGSVDDHIAYYAEIVDAYIITEE